MAADDDATPPKLRRTQRRGRGRGGKPKRATLRQLLDALPPELRRRALTHASWAATPGDSYERLEFLGDSVLGMAVALDLFDRYPDAPEGELSRMRAAAVSRDACAVVAREAGLDAVFVAEAPPEADPELVRSLAGKERMVAALTESVIGAATIALGLDEVLPVVISAFRGRMQHAVENQVDAKSALQELAQRRGDQIDYEVEEIVGPDHDRMFTIVARLGSTHEARGAGRTKKAAEQEAAARLLDELTS